jgi:cell pole-organizing protein PopZ
MAEEKSAEQEPSIEEILDSIRQIISDDDGTGAAAADTGGSVGVSGAEEEDAETPEDVIELTERADPKPHTEEKPAPPPPPAAKPKPEPTPQAAKPEPPKPEPKPIEVDMEEPEDNTESADEDSILTRKAADAAYEGFAELARKTAVEHDGITLEEIVRTELKPLLRDWLDKNLPGIIQRLVREELERVAKKAIED